MRKFTKTYQKFSKITATLLLLAFLIPSGLHAKQLVDFCLMEIVHHETTEMADDHSCCVADEPVHNKSDQHQQHDCGWIGICACDIGDTTLSNFQWTTVSNDFTAVFSKQFDLTPFITSDEPIDNLLLHQLRQNSPPLWLMYDTFLM